MFPNEVYFRRRLKLTSYVSDGIGLFLGNNLSPMNYPANPYRFRQDSSFLYLFGIDKPCLAGIMDFNSGESFLFGDDPEMDDVIWEGPVISMVDLGQRASISKVFPMKMLGKMIDEALDQRRPIHFLPACRAENKLLLSELLGVKAGQINERVSLQLIQSMVALRSVKESCELDELRFAWDVGYEMHEYAMRHALEGYTEKELAGKLEGIAISKGAQVSFPVILTQHGEVLNQHEPGGALHEGRLLLVDAGAESLLHYASDFTRTTPVGHKFSNQQLEIYELVLAANNFARQLIKPGVRYLDIHLETARLIADGLKSIGLMKGDPHEAVDNGAHALFFPHGLGHLIGLDVHDMEDYGQVYVGFDRETRPSEQFGTSALRFGRRLEEGHVLTVEPGIYFIPPLIEQWQQQRTGEAFIDFRQIKKYLDFGGIRIEDTVLVTRNACSLLGKRLPVNPDELKFQ